jgi:C4-dicarboxylate transporter, DctM subunit
MTQPSPTLEVPRDDPSAAEPGTGSERPGAVVYVLLWLGTLVTAYVMVWGGLERQSVGLLLMVLMLLLLGLDVPIGLAMVMSSCVALYALGGLRVVESSLTTQPFDAVASWSLSVVPLFILLGMFIWRGGIADSAYACARQWFGRVPGGLGVATNFAGAILSAGSGSTIGTSYALGRMALPQMFSAGYSPRMATAVVAMAGTLGQIIPPSILLVIYAGIAETPVSQQLLAGFVPGLILATAFAAVVVGRVLITPSMAPRPDLSDVTWSTRFRSLLGLVPLAFIIGIVIGGMFLGWFTATESASFGCLAALLVIWRPWSRTRRTPVRELTSVVRTSTREAALSLGSLVFLIIGSVALTRALAMSGVTRELTDFLVGLDLSRELFLILLIVFYMVLGTFMEPLPMMLLTVPILAVPLETMGVDMIWFGIFIVVLAEMGIVTPPVGILVYVVHRIAQRPEINNGVRVTVAEVFWGVIPFLVTTCAVLVFLIFVPDVVTWLPSLAAD